jgi:hypothetical protein
MGPNEWERLIASIDPGTYQGLGYRLGLSLYASYLKDQVERGFFSLEEADILFKSAYQWRLEALQTGRFEQSIYSRENILSIAQNLKEFTPEGERLYRMFERSPIVEQLAVRGMLLGQSERELEKEVELAWEAFVHSHKSTSSDEALRAILEAITSYASLKTAGFPEDKRVACIGQALQAAYMAAVQDDRIKRLEGMPLGPKGNEVLKIYQDALRAASEVVSETENSLSGALLTYEQALDYLGELWAEHAYMNATLDKAIWDFYIPFLASREGDALGVLGWITDLIWGAWAIYANVNQLTLGLRGLASAGRSLRDLLTGSSRLTLSTSFTSTAMSLASKPSLVSIGKDLFSGAFWLFQALVLPPIWDILQFSMRAPLTFRPIWDFVYTSLYEKYAKPTITQVLASLPPEGFTRENLRRVFLERVAPTLSAMNTLAAEEAASLGEFLGIKGMEVSEEVPPIRKGTYMSLTPEWVDFMIGTYLDRNFSAALYWATLIPFMEPQHSVFFVRLFSYVQGMEHLVQGEMLSRVNEAYTKLSGLYYMNVDLESLFMWLRQAESNLPYPSQTLRGYARSSLSPASLIQGVLKDLESLPPNYVLTDAPFGFGYVSVALPLVPAELRTQEGSRNFFERYYGMIKKAALGAFFEELYSKVEGDPVARALAISESLKRVARLHALMDEPSIKDQLFLNFREFLETFKEREYQVLTPSSQGGKIKVKGKYIWPYVPILFVSWLKENGVIRKLWSEYGRP